MIASVMVALVVSAVPRVGVFVGSNAAPSGREPLLHAETDAARMRQVFVELGGLDPERTVLLDGPTADEILSAIRRAGEIEGAIVVFYYSGHADDRALLLGGTELPFHTLTRALSAVPSQLSLHLIDACRSGALTRRKGAALGERFSVSSAPAGEGKVVITSSAEWEDSQESDRLGGSFFTLHLASALRGAADTDGDARVTLSEAYRYVYGRTVESTLATVAGPQHPTFRYDLRGQGDLVLTWTTRGAGALMLGAGDYLVLDELSGHIVAEVATGPNGARLALAPGSYRIRKRTQNALWTGRTRIEAGRTYVADELLAERVAHARLVRKGGVRDPLLAHGLRLTGGIRSRVDERIGAAGLFRLGYELSLPWLSVAPYGAVTTSATFATPRLQYDVFEIGFGVALSRAFDFSMLTLRGSLFLEAVRFSQTEAERREPPRSTWANVAAIGAGIETRPLYDFVLALSGEAAFYTYRSTDATVAPAAGGEVVTRPAFRAMLTIGYEL